MAVLVLDCGTFKKGFFVEFRSFPVDRAVRTTKSVLTSWGLCASASNESVGIYTTGHIKVDKIPIDSPSGMTLAEIAYKLGRLDDYPAIKAARANHAAKPSRSNNAFRKGK